MSLIDRFKKLFDPPPKITMPVRSPIAHEKATEASPLLTPLLESDITPQASSPYQLRQALNWRTSNFNSVTWSPDGQHIAAGSEDRCVHIWNATTGELKHLLEGHREEVRSVAWAPDGRWLASGSFDGTVRV